MFLAYRLVDFPFPSAAYFYSQSGGLFVICYYMEDGRLSDFTFYFSNPSGKKMGNGWEVHLSWVGAFPLHHLSSFPQVLSFPFIPSYSSFITAIA